jgi:hypothetical protein
MKGVWIDSEVLQRTNISALAKILLGWITSLAKGGNALSLPTQQIASMLGTTAQQVRAALYELQCAKLVAAVEERYILATNAPESETAPRKYRIPEGWAVVAVSKHTSMIQREQGWGACVRVAGVPADEGEETDPELQKWIEQIHQRFAE